MHTQENERNLLKNILKILGVFLISFGILIIAYVFFPLFYWQLFFAPNFSDQRIITPIPNTELVTEKSIQNLFANATYNRVDSSDATTWFPKYRVEKNNQTKIKSYTISIPKLKIKNAVVSTTDTDLTKHLVNYSDTPNPPEKGNAVIFGHSSLPQFFNPKDYKTIFTYLYKLQPGDEIIVNYSQKIYKYSVEDIILVDPEDISVLAQNYSSSYLTLVTCAPPGTVWKRLIIRATIRNI